MPIEINGTQYESYVVENGSLAAYDMQLGDGTQLFTHSNFEMLDEPTGGTFDSGWNDTSGWTAYDGYAETTNNYPTGLRWGEERFGAGSTFRFDHRSDPASAGFELRWGKGSQSINTGDGYVARVYASGYDIYEMHGGDNTATYVNYNSISATAGTWYEVTVDWDDTNNEITFTYDGNSLTFPVDHTGTLGGWSWITAYQTSGEVNAIRNLRVNDS